MDKDVNDLADEDIADFFSSAELECTFLAGGRVAFDRRYVHMNGHTLEERLREADVYPFLISCMQRRQVA